MFMIVGKIVGVVCVNVGMFWVRVIDNYQMMMGNQVKVFKKKKDKGGR